MCSFDLCSTFLRQTFSEWAGTFYSIFLLGQGLITTSNDVLCHRNFLKHQQHLQLKGLQPKPINGRYAVLVTISTTMLKHWLSLNYSITSLIYSAFIHRARSNSTFMVWSFTTATHWKKSGYMWIWSNHTLPSVQSTLPNRSSGFNASELLKMRSFNISSSLMWSSWLPSLSAPWKPAVAGAPVTKTGAGWIFSHHLYVTGGVFQGSFRFFQSSCV